jgi:MOSC domain-containing protein YiiM
LDTNNTLSVPDWAPRNAMIAILRIEAYNGSMMSGKIVAVCLSEKKGTAKHDVQFGELRACHGLVGDAHAGNWHRQVSLLSFEKIREFQSRGAKVQYGDFGENIVADGIDFRSLPVGTVLRAGQATLVVTQIGKECHSHCAIFQTMGDCIMPREGVFAVVTQGGAVALGDRVEIVPEGGYGR